MKNNTSIPEVHPKKTGISSRELAADDVITAQAHDGPCSDYLSTRITAEQFLERLEDLLDAAQVARWQGADRAEELGEVMAEAEEVV